MEKNFPIYSERSECVGVSQVWGECKLGRIPEFLYVDACTNARSADTGNCTEGDAHSAEAEDVKEAENYKAKYLRCF